MYDFDIDLPFTLGFNLESLPFFLNIAIPIIYFANFIFLVTKLRKMEKDAPFYAFIKSLVYFFFFYGLGAAYFVWYDFFYMDFTCPNPIDVLFYTIEAPPGEVIYMWMIGNLLQNIGLVLMIIQLRKRVFKGKFRQNLPLFWEAIGIGFTIFCYINFFLSLVQIPFISDMPYFWIEMLFLFNFAWSITLPLTYSYIWKNAAGNIKRYAFILFICFIIYGITWGLRARTAVYLLVAMFQWVTLFGLPLLSFEFIWLLRAGSIVLNLSLVLYGYRKLLKEF